MCGITGIFEFDRSMQVDHDLLRRMCRIMQHRGPDDDGVFVDGNVGLGMRRLSIIDIANGHQPLSNEDGTVWIVFNGEIYNQSDLRQRLQTRGHRFRSHSDTEVIVHLYEEYGRHCVQHLRGMFAFAIWDARQRKLFVARDRLGIKPLYYYVSHKAFVFASEIKVLFAYPGVRPNFRRGILPEYLAFGYLSGPETFYEGVLKLMPGYTLEINESGGLDTRQYWDVPVPEEDGGHGESYYVETYRGLLEESVRSHLMSDVPLGVFLSGGVDSSAVAALMTRMTRTPIETFSVGYEEQNYSELPHARAVSRHLKSNHHEILVSEKQFFETLPKVIWHEDEPLAWPSSIALYFVAHLAQRHVKVVLTGEGSDETLAGYTRYAFTLRNAVYDRHYRRYVPAGIRRRIRSHICRSQMINANLRRKLSHTFLARDGQEWQVFYFDNFFSAFGEGEQREILRRQVAAELPPGAPYLHAMAFWERSSGEMLSRLLYTDIKTYLVELLMKQDNMSMAASVESRVPFLDHGLVEFAREIPPRFQVNGLAGKSILKKAMRGLLPDSILHRKKLGFPTPWATWSNGARIQIIQDFLSEGRTLSRGLFAPHAIDRLFAEHRSGYKDHSDQIWRLLNLELWQRVCLEGEPHAGAWAAEPPLTLSQ